MTWVTRSFLIAMFAGGLLALGLTMVPFGRATGYGNSGRCMSALTASPPSGVNSIIIGSSRTRRGIGPERLERLLGLAPHSFANLGHPSMSPAYDYATIDRLTKNRKFRYVLIEIRPYGPAQRRMELELDPTQLNEVKLAGGNFDSMFLLSTGYREQMGLAGRLAEGPVAAGWNRVQLFLQRIGMQLSLFVRPKFLKEHVVKTLKNPHPERAEGHDGRNTICFLKKWASPTEEAQHGDKRARALRETFARNFKLDRMAANESPMSYFTAPETAPERTMVEEIRRLGEERGFRPVFFYLPAVQFPASEEEVTYAFERRFGVPLLIPDRATRTMLEDGGYWDNAHLNTSGRAIFTDWIAAQVKARGIAPQ